MNTATLLHSFSSILTALLLVLLTTSDVTPPPSSPVPGGCADSVISFSPCLPYISAPPNDLSDQPSSQCCDIYDGAFDSGEAECLCYLVRQSTLLGFPLNASKLLSLSDLCSLNNNAQGSQPNDTNPSLQSICSGSPTLPPLLSTTSKPHSGSKAPPPPSTITMPRSANRSSRPPTSKPSTPQQQSNNGNHLAPANDIVLMSICLLAFVRILIILNQLTVGMEVNVA